MTLPIELYHPDLWAELHEKYPEDYPDVDQELIREHKAKAIRQKYSQLMLQAVSPYSGEEQKTWPMQVEEANLWLNDPNASVPFITALAQGRNIPLDELVRRIKENDALFRQGVGMLLGMQQAELDALYNS